jgi:hypothetical protein
MPRGLPSIAGVLLREHGLGLAANRPPEGVIMPEQLTDAELQALAAVFHDRLAARHVLAAAGFAVEWQPHWQAATSEQFWHEVNAKLAAGILPDGRRRVLAAAADRYPANPLFRTGASNRRESADGAATQDSESPGADKDQAPHPLASNSTRFSVDARGSQGVMIGDGGSQTLYFGAAPDDVDS